jgi:peptide/nickel transport system substrate-binding protein
MKRTLLTTMLILFVATTMVFATGSRETAPSVKQIRIAEQVPGLITPGVWDGQAFSMNSSIYEYLIEMNAETGALDPCLATSWETVDGSVWTFKLREGVTFHDGSSFTAEDVKFTLERTQDPAVGHLKKADFEVVEKIETPDAHTVVVYLKEARPTFVYQLTDYNMPILSSSYDYASFGESKPMGTGPFRMKQLVPKESALLERYEDYWAPGLPKVDQLAIYFVADIDASISMLESNRVDVVPFVTPVIKRRLDAVDGISVISPYQEQRFISMRVDQKPFDDNRVRLAFKYAMDPQVIARSVAQMDLNDGVFYNETPIMNALAEYKDIPLRGRDVEKAKQLLREAGYPNGLKVELYYASDHPFGRELSQTIKELAMEAGIDIDLKGYTRDIYLSQYWLNVPISLTGWAGRVDPSMLLALAFAGTGPWNESHLNDQVVNELIRKISSQADPAIRTGYYHELQQWFHENGPLINVQVPLLVAISDKIVDYKHPLSQLPQYKYMDIL